MENKINYPFVLMVIMVTSIVWLTGFFVFGRPAGENVLESPKPGPILFNTFSTTSNINARTYQALIYWDQVEGKEYLEMYSRSEEPLYTFEDNTLVYEILPESGTYISKDLVWAPENLYFTLSNGQYGQDIYLSNTGKLVTSLENLSEGMPSIYWIKNNLAVYMYSEKDPASEEFFTNRPWGTGNATGVALIEFNGDTAEVKKIYRPTITEDYQLDISKCKSAASLCADIEITQLSVENPEDWNQINLVSEENISLNF